MKIWKISHGTAYFTDETIALMKKNNCVSVHPDTLAKGRSSIAQGEYFIDAEKYDLFYVCRSNELVDFLGMFIDERPLYSLVPGHNDWVERQYCLIQEAKNPENYNKGHDRWWSPKSNSTFIEINPDQYDEFEKEYLLPVFNISFTDMAFERNKKKREFSTTLSKIIDLQNRFHNLFNDKTFLFSELHRMDEIELKKLEYEYDIRGEHIEKQPVVLLRKKIIQHLLANKTIDEQIINDFKKEIGSKFVKNVFLVWGEPFRVLYPLFFAKYKNDLEIYMNRFIDLVRQELNVFNITNKTLNHFDGAQNQGSNRIWFAIYNSTYNSQKHAFQLFFEISEMGIKYGLLHKDAPDRNQLITVKNLNWKMMILEFSKHLDIIKGDNSKLKALMYNFIDLLYYKKQIILQGPPGTGKTYTAKDIAEMMIFNEVSFDKKRQKEHLEESGQCKILQFHPAYSYEDFVRGISVKPMGDKIFYKAENRTMGEYAKVASKNYSDNKDEEDQMKYILIIDEINRANLPSVLGELIYAMEYRNESVESIYDIEGEGKELKLPPNLYIIGTMNTADRSVGHIDYAIRRRFAFVDLLPLLSVVEETKNDKAVQLFKAVSTLFYNDYVEGKLDTIKSIHLAADFEPYQVMLGHSYFLAENDDILQKKLIYEILPILREYIKDGILIKSKELEKVMSNLNV